MVKNTLFFYFIYSCTSVAYAQFTILSIPHSKQEKNNQAVNARTHEEELEAISLPFWDDFSFSNTNPYPHDTLWQFGESVWISNSIGINAPSLGVATFDGLDSLGNPYSTNDILEKGVADRLVSAPLRLDLVPSSERESVILSFYYQYQGHGEPPDTGDKIQVLFKSSNGLWEVVHTIESDETSDASIFVPALIPITGAKYLHDDFQFIIQSYGRLSGPYDTWLVDYVYLNSKRSLTDMSYPDRTIYAPLSSLFNDYWSMPIHHFMENPITNITAPILSLHNLEFIPGNTTQEDHHSLSYNSMDSIIVYGNGTKRVYTHSLDDATFFGVIMPLEFSSKSIKTTPSFSDLLVTDSIAVIKLKLWVNTNDNLIHTNENPLGDYNPIKYAPINFRHNDTTYVEFVLSDYYAYDDGTAEYGATLNKSGARLAYLFNMETTKIDTIDALNMYFPSFGNSESQSIEIQILADLHEEEHSILYSETVIIKQNLHNQFWTHLLNQPVVVKNKFYVGWRQISNTKIVVGLDKNSNSADKIFYNTNGTWEQDNNISGSLMIRPRFGKGIKKEVITHIKESQINSDKTYIFPNPNHGVFTIYGSNIQQIQLFDLMGRSVDWLAKKERNKLEINIYNTQGGTYILNLLSNNKMATHRIVVK